MQGQILYFNEGEGIGIISDDEGDRYNFAKSDWCSGEKPKSGDRVDFLPDGNKAGEVFIVQRIGAGNGVSTQKTLQNSDFGQRLSALFNNGLHNKFGVTVVGILLISLFLPVYEVPVLGTINLMHIGFGKLIMLLLAITGVLFYGGATRSYVKILSIAVAGTLLFVYSDLAKISSSTEMLSGFIAGSENDFGFFDMLQWGSFVNAGSCLVLLFAAFKKEYVKNEKAL